MGWKVKNLLLRGARLIRIQLAAISNHSLIEKADNATFAMSTAADISKSIHIFFKRDLWFDSKILVGDDVVPAGRMNFQTKKQISIEGLNFFGLFRPFPGQAAVAQAQSHRLSSD